MLKPNFFDTIFVTFVLFWLIFLSAGCGAMPAHENQQLIDEISRSLKTEVLDAWYPRSIDTVGGGFITNFSFDWKALDVQTKMIVTQARHVWTTSAAAKFYQDDQYRLIARHGFHFLKDKMWDAEYGGFFTFQQKASARSIGDNKLAYGNAFAIYALAAYYAVSNDTAALSLAKKTFYWLEKHAYDSEHKGYINILNRDGSWSSARYSDRMPGLLSGAGLKDQNSSIHLLEAFTELYRVWPDRLLRERTIELLHLIRDRITTPKGYMTLFFERDWTPISFRDSAEAVRKTNQHFDNVSFGHDVETAYLMLETSHVLGLEISSKTLPVAKKMVDHAFAKGWDEATGGFYYAGYYFNDSDSITIINKSKQWWVQAEALNAFLLMSKFFPNEKKYADAFQKQWEYIKKYLIDHEYGDWYVEGLDINPKARKSLKAQSWKGNYHNVRALINCIQMLKGEFELIRR